MSTTYIPPAHLNDQISSPHHNYDLSSSSLDAANILSSPQDNKSRRKLRRTCLTPDCLPSPTQSMPSSSPRKHQHDSSASPMKMNIFGSRNGCSIFDLSSKIPHLTEDDSSSHFFEESSSSSLNKSSGECDGRDCNDNKKSEPKLISFSCVNGECESSSSSSKHNGISGTLARNAKKVAAVPLVPLDCKFGLVSEIGGGDTVTLEDVVKHESRSNGCNVTVVFAIRRPGCGACREHGQQLSELSKTLEKDHGILDVTFCGIVKETGVDDTSLLEFYQDYFHFPLYKDTDWKIYKAMGNRKISLASLAMGLLRSSKRHSEKGIETKSILGEGWIQGGVMIFNKDGELKYAQEEDYGYELDTEEIAKAIQTLRDVDVKPEGIQL